MKDRVAAKPNRYAVYDDNHNFIRYEYHERADEPTEVGSALNKANMLPDDVAAALGLTGGAQVKDALGKLSAAALRKVIFPQPIRQERLVSSLTVGSEITIDGIEFSVVASDYKSSNSKCLFPKTSDNNGPYTVREQKKSLYIDSLPLDFKNMVTISGIFTMAELNGGIPYFSKGTRVRQKSYWTDTLSGGDSCYYVNTSGNFDLQYGTNNYYATLPYLVIPDSNKLYVISENVFVTNQIYTPQVNQLVDMLGNEFVVGTQIETGSYVGTGTYGSANPNSLTFGFIPKVVFLTDMNGGNYGVPHYVWGAKGFTISYSQYTYSNYCTVIGNTLSWYNSSSAQNQLNSDGIAYLYVAIG